MANLDGSNERILFDNTASDTAFVSLRFSPDGLSFISREITGAPGYDSGVAIGSLEGDSEDFERFSNPSYDVLAPIWGPKPQRLPRTRIVAGPSAEVRQGELVPFEFESSLRLSGFECSLARGENEPSYSACASPLTYEDLKPGRYEFLVRSVIQGESEPIPASRNFVVERRPDPDPVPKLRLKVDDWRHPATSDGLLEDGVSARVKCSLNCKATMTLIVSERTAEELGLDSREIGRGSRTLRARQPERVRATLSRAAADAIGKNGTGQPPFIQREGRRQADRQGRKNDDELAARIDSVERGPA